MKKILLTIVAVLVLMPMLVAAHGLVTTQTAQSGQYLIEFEYDTIGNVLAGDLTTFGVYLLDQNKNPVDFDGVYIKISKPNGAPVLVANLQEAPDVLGSARMSGILKEAGDYLAEAHFNKDKTVIARSDFKFTADQGIGSDGGGLNASNKKTIALTLVGGIILGFALALLLKRR